MTHEALLFAGMLQHRRNTEPQARDVRTCEQIGWNFAGLQCLSHLEGLCIRIASGKAEDGTWTACFLHSVLKVCLSTVAGCLLASHWVVLLPVRHMGMQ